MDQKTYEQKNCCNATDVQDFDIQSLGELTMALRELLPTGARQVRSNTRITSRRFTKTNGAVAGKVHTANFAWVDLSSVVATGSWSSPRVDSLSADAYAHGVANLDVVDIAPTDCVTPQRVDDLQALIANVESWLVQDQVEGCCGQGSSTCCNENSSQAAAQNRADNHANDDDVCNPRSEDAASAAKTLHVGHPSILAQGGLDV